MKGLAGRAQAFAASALLSRNLADVLWVGSGTAVGGALGALYSAILARGLGVEEYGVFTLIMSLVLMLAALCDFGISGSMVKFGAESLARGEEGRLRLVLGLGAQAKFLVTAAVVAASVVFLKPILGAVGARLDARIEMYFLFSLGMVVLLSGSQFFPPVYQIFRRFRAQALASVSGPAVKVVVLLVLVAASLRPSVGVALWIEATAALTFLIVYWSRAPLRSFNWRLHDRELRSSMLSFNKWLSIYLVVTTLGGRVDVVMLGGLADARALGLYGAAMKVISLTLVLGNAYLTVLLPDFASVVDLAALRRKRRNALLMALAMCGGLGLLALLAWPLVRILYGPSFDDVAPLLRVMVAGTGAVVLGYPITGSLYVLNKSVVFAAMSLVSVGVLAALCWLLIPSMGAMGAAVAYTCGGIASTAVAAVYYLGRGKGLEAGHRWQEAI